MENNTFNALLPLNKIELLLIDSDLLRCKLASGLIITI